MLTPRRSAVLLLVLCSVLGVSRHAAAQTTAAFVDSQPGDSIGGGTQWHFTSPTNRFYTENDWSGTSVSIVGAGGSRGWSFDFSAAGLPRGPVPGVYNAARAIGSGNLFNGIDISAESGCSSLYGRFVVLEAEYAPDGSVVRFAADFEQHCQDRDAGLFGAVRYNSTISTLVPFGGAYPAYRLTLTAPAHGRIVGSGLDCAADSLACTTSVDAPAILTEVTAVPDPGYIFGGWSGDCSGGPHATVHLNMIRVCAALFLPAVPSAPRTLAIFGGAPNAGLGVPTQVLSAGNSAWAFTPYQSGFRMSMTWLSPLGLEDIGLLMIPPPGEVFQAGRQYTTTPNFIESTQARFEFTFRGGGCDGTASLAVRDWLAGDDGLPVRFAIDLEHQCQSPWPQASPTVITLLYNSSFDYARLAGDSSALQFFASRGAGGTLQLPAGQSLQLSPSNATAATRIVRSSQSWLGVAPVTATAATPAAVSILAGVPLLPAVSATGHLEVMARGAVSVLDVPVTVNVGSPPDYSNYPFAVFRAGTGVWLQPNAAPQAAGSVGDIPLSGDFDGDGVPDVALYRPSTGEWFLKGRTAVQWGLPGDIPVPADYDGDGVTDIAVFRQSSAGAQWFIRGRAPRVFGEIGDIPVPADYDGDGRAELAVFHPRTGRWHFLWTGGGTDGVVTVGGPGDIPVAADFDGDRIVDIAVFRPSTGIWYIRRPNGDIYSRQFGLPGDIPVPADVTGDGRAELRVWRPSTGMWYAYDRWLGGTTSRQYGLPGDLPIAERPVLPSPRPTDVDGDGVADIAVYRPSTGEWFTRLSVYGYGGTTAAQWGLPGDIPVRADYDGDRRADPAVYRPSSGQWFIAPTTASPLIVAWGLPGDVPVPADYDGDGRADIAIYRPATGEWWVLTSASGYSSYRVWQWGLPTDTPLTGDFDGDGRADAAVYRPSSGEWFIKLSSGGSMYRVLGTSGDIPLVRDFDGDGRADFAVFRPATGEWFAVDAFGAVKTWQWGVNGDVPVSDDYDGDGVADVAVYRPSTGEWFVIRSSDGAVIYLQWGLPGDVPVVRR